MRDARAPSFRRRPGRRGGDPDAVRAPQAPASPVWAPDDPARARRHGRGGRAAGRRGRAPPGRVGHRAEWVTKTLVQHAPPTMEIEFVEQLTRTGTGDALAVGLTGLPDDDDDEGEDVVVLPGDTPLLRPQTLAALVRYHRAEDAGATLLTAEVEDPSGYGRVVHGKDGVVCRVVEEVDATDEEKAITEINTSIYCFRRSILAPALRRLTPANAQGEYYLTDAVSVLFSAGYRVQSLVLPDSMEAAGVNDRAQLAGAEAGLRDRINERWMRRGVTMWDPERTYVDAEVQLTTDVSLLPGVILRGRCVIGEGSEVGPNCVLTDTVVGRRAVVTQSTCDRGTIGDGARVGPFCVVQPGAEVGPDAVIPPHSVVALEQ